MIKIASKITIPKIQLLYQELQAGDTEVIDIQLPKRIEKLEFGVLSCPWSVLSPTNHFIANKALPPRMLIEAHK